VSLTVCQSQSSSRATSATVRPHFGHDTIMAFLKDETTTFLTLD
jgi:hypothetical protein